MIRGADGHSYLPLGLEDFVKMRQDVQLYCYLVATHTFRKSHFSPEWWNRCNRAKDLSWYGGNSIYYIRVDTSKPEYEPI